MKLYLPLLALSLLAACSQDANDAEGAAASAPVAAPDPAAEPAAAGAATNATATGTVESVDAEGGRIVIAHGPVEALKWPPMTMGFKATPEQLQAVQAGQQVRFEFVSQGPSNTVTRIEPMQ